jgi:hypothetical protein
LACRLRASPQRAELGERLLLDFTRLVFHVAFEAAQ